MKSRSLLFLVVALLSVLPGCCGPRWCCHRPLFSRCCHKSYGQPATCCGYGGPAVAGPVMVPYGPPLGTPPPTMVPVRPQ